VPNYLAEGDAMLINLYVEGNIRNKELALISHRGGKSFGPENTLESLDAALKYGVEMVETDVRMSSDGVPVIHHNPFLGINLLSRMSMSEIRIKAPEVPTLQEYLVLSKDRCSLNLEIKKCQATILAETISNTSAMDSLLISSFDAAFLKEFGRTGSKAELGLLTQYENRPEKMIQEAIECGASTLLPVSYSVDRELVIAVHDAGLRLITWTINNIHQLKDMIAADIDGVITDFYRELKEFLESGRQDASAVAPLLGESPGHV
jgi:glycerophosphoryl diester phosphodiesterase